MVKRVRFSLAVSRTQPVEVDFPDRLVVLTLIAGATQTVETFVSKKVALMVLIDPEEV